MAGVMRLYDRCVTGLAVLAGGLIAAVAALIVVDVGLRTLGFRPLAATVALTEYALLYFTMFAAPWLVRRRGHVAVRVLFDRLPVSLRGRWDTALAAFAAAAAGAIAVAAIVLLAESWTLGDMESRSIDMPRWLLFLPLAVGFTAVAAEFLRIAVTPARLHAEDAGPMEKV